MIDAQLIALITGVLGAFAGLAKWTVGVWAAVRREGAEHARSDNERMIAAMVSQAASNATLVGRIDLLASQLAALSQQLGDGFDSISKVDNVVPREYREPAPRLRERAQTPPSGHQIREPRRGSHHDPEE